MQVPLLLHMGEPQLALEKALASGDTELLHLVILHAKDNLPPEPFLPPRRPPRKRCRCSWATRPRATPSSSRTATSTATLTLTLTLPTLTLTLAP